MFDCFRHGGFAQPAPRERRQMVAEKGVHPARSLAEESFALVFLSHNLSDSRPSSRCFNPLLGRKRPCFSSWPTKRLEFTKPRRQFGTSFMPAKLAQLSGLFLALGCC